MLVEQTNQGDVAVMAAAPSSGSPGATTTPPPRRSTKVLSTGGRGAEEDRRQNATTPPGSPVSSSIAEELSPPSSPPDVRPASPVGEPHGAAEEMGPAAAAASTADSAASASSAVITPSSSPSSSSALRTFQFEHQQCLAPQPLHPPPPPPTTSEPPQSTRLGHALQDLPPLPPPPSRQSEATTVTVAPSEAPTNSTSFSTTSPSLTESAEQQRVQAAQQPHHRHHRCPPQEPPARLSSPFSTSTYSSGYVLLQDRYLLQEQSDSLTWVTPPTTTTTTAALPNPTTADSSSPAASTGPPAGGPAAPSRAAVGGCFPSQPTALAYKCVDVVAMKQYTCKSIPCDPRSQPLLSAHYRVEGHPHINPIREVVSTPSRTYLLFPPADTDLHSYVRTRRRLKEPHARHLFAQIVSAVHEAHSKGIVLRDLKLRKFVFTNESRDELKLESLEDAVVLEDEADDSLTDKHGCPAYVSPEILRCNTVYSGRAADMWGLGVMLYTMLVGRYPFHGQEHQGLFAKIRRGQFSLPDSISSRARCLIRCLLRKNPDDRLTTEDVLIHPWITQAAKERPSRHSGHSGSSSGSSSRHGHCHSHRGSAIDGTGEDQAVPLAKRRLLPGGDDGDDFEDGGVPAKLMRTVAGTTQRR